MQNTKTWEHTGMAVQTLSICPVYSGVSSYSPNVFGRPSKTEYQSSYFTCSSSLVI